MPTPEPSPSDRPVRGAHVRPRQERVLARLLLAPLFGFLTGIPAILVGAQALSDITSSDGRLIGRGTAWLGVVLGADLGTLASAGILGYRSQ